MNMDSGRKTAYEKPQTELQQKLVELWEENLGIKGIGITDNYFTLGGDSLKAIRLMSRIEELGYSININSVFRCTTVKDMAAEIEK
jgi:acyl carrier protein